MRARAHAAANLFPLLLAALLAGMTYWLDLASRPQAGESDGRSRHDPDFVIENFELRRFDPEGMLQHTLRAREMRHYPDDDSSVILAPDLTYHRDPPTHVVARTALMTGEGKHVELVDDVRITRGATGGKPATVLSTGRLDVWPDAEIASTRTAVTLVQGRNKIVGSGMDARHQSATYILAGPVRGIFDRSTDK